MATPLVKIKPEKEEPPPFDLNDTDKWVLSQTDEEFKYHDWEDLRNIIADNNLSILKRKPSDLRRYISWTRDIQARYGSVTNYICQERLKWTPLPSSPSSNNEGPRFPYKNPTPFADPDDYKILPNDWPYGLTPDIYHIVVWLKQQIPVNDTNGDLTADSRPLVEQFVKSMFVDRLETLIGSSAEDRVQWFKNWTTLQSVRALEHIHILVRGVPGQVIETWTGEAVKN